MHANLTIARTIEQGYFVFTLMPSLTCELNCPHCYLSLEQRRSHTRMSLTDLQIACERIAEYYQARRLPRKTIVCYWYGGEPTSVGQDYFTHACDIINAVFAKHLGYTVRHTVLSALIGVDTSWYPLFAKYCGSEIQSSFDWLMRGRGYLRKWEAAVTAVRAHGLTLSTISVVNRTMLDVGATFILDYLADQNVAQASFLPFMWNEQNDNGAYGSFAPTMREYSAFMRELTCRQEGRLQSGMHAPIIGQREFILQKSYEGRLGNIAGQTLFLLPNGDFALPDYRQGCQEYLRPFGNILREPFEQILTSHERRAYLRKQMLQADNPECRGCAYSDCCLMEFWKTNRPGDDCFGARDYVSWLLARSAGTSNYREMVIY